ncbi:MAG: ATP-binding protein [Actinoallomurus sp.]
MTPDPAVALTGRPRSDYGPTVIKLRACPSAISSARRSVTAMLSGLVPDDHLDTVELSTSELVTNAYGAATRWAEFMQFGWSHYDTPIHLAVLATPLWTRLDVRDPETRMTPAKPRGLLDETGRGLDIVEGLGGHLAHTIAPHHKIVYAVLPVNGELTAAELAAAFPKGSQRWETA